MRRLKVALVALFAVVLSLALFACGKKASDWLDEIVVSGTGSITITDAAKEADARTELDKLTFTAIYAMGTEDRTIPADEYTVDWSGVQFGTTGNYTAVVTTKKDNQYNLTANVTVTINHNFGVADAEGTQVCSVCSAVSQTKTINDSFSVAGWHDGVTVGNTNEYVVHDPRYGNATSVVGRLDKGMSIKLVGTGKSTSTANAYYYPVLGVGNLEEGGSILQRNDNWSIYDAMSGGPSNWALSSNKDANTSGWPGAEAAEEKVVYVDGTISSATDYNVEAGIPVELTWEYSEDCVFTMTWYNPTLDNGRLRTARVKLPDRQFYNAILHGEMFEATFTQVQVVQSLKLKEVGTASVKDAKKVLENKYLDASCLDIDVTYEGGKTGKADAGLLTVYGNTEVVTELPEDNTAKGGMNYNGTGEEWVDLTSAGTAAKVSTAFQSYKVRVALGNDWFEQILSADATNAIKAAVVKNAVDHGNANDVTVGDVLFPATALNPIEFVQTSDNKAGVSVSGTAATLSTAQAAKLTLGTGTAKHYVAFSLYTDPEGGATKFAGTPTVTGTKGAVAVAADGARLDVVLAVSADVKSATISGVNGGTDIVVSFGTIGGYAVTSTLSANTLKINETKQITIEYDISGVTAVKDAATAASQLKLSINGVNKTLKANGNDLTPGTKTVTGFAGLSVDQVTYATGKLTVKYTLPKMNPAKPVGYTFALFTGSETLASDRVFYTLEFAANDNAVVDGYYAVADGNYLYLLKPYTGTNIQSSALAQTLNVTLNAGAETGKNAKTGDTTNYKTYAYMQDHNMSFTVANGAVNFTNPGLLADLVTGNLTVFGGELDNSEDTDYGAVVVLRIDTREVGVREQSYGFSVNADKEHPAYSPVTYNDGEFTIGQAKSYTLPANAVNLTTGNCLDSSDVAYEVDGSSTTTKFYAFASYKYDAHAWVKGQDNLYTCSTCGAVRNYDATKPEEDVAAEAKLAKLGKQTTPEQGLTATFEIRNATGDWGSWALVTGKGDVRITLPNLDAFFNSFGRTVYIDDDAATPDVDESASGKEDDPTTKDVDESKKLQNGEHSIKVEGATAEEEALGKKMQVGGLFPAAENKVNGGDWNCFLGAYAHVTVTVSKTTGVNYYLNGVLKITYPANTAMTTASVADFAELFIVAANHYGVYLNLAGAPMENFTVYPKAVTAAQVLDLYKEYVDTMGEPEAPAVPEYSAIQEPTEAKPIEIGTAAHDLAFSATTPLWIGNPVTKGHKVVATGTMTSLGAMAWQTVITNLFSGSACKVGVRMDNWLQGFEGPLEGAEQAAEKWHAVMEGAVEGDDKDPLFLALIKDCKITITWDWTNETKIVVSVKYESKTVTETTETAYADHTVSYTVTSTAEGGAFLQDSYNIGLGGEKIHLLITNITRT